jgi:hypothetical protein
MDFARSAITEIKAQPWFNPETHGPMVMAKLNAMTPKEQLRYGGTYGALMRANQIVLHEQWAAIQQGAQASVEQDYRRKAAASTGTVTGSAQVGASTKRPTNEEELARHLAAKAAAAGGVA